MTPPVKFKERPGQSGLVAGHRSLHAMCLFTVIITGTDSHYQRIVTDGGAFDTRRFLKIRVSPAT
jgi:hypothetical protein